MDSEIGLFLRYFVYLFRFFGYSFVPTRWNKQNQGFYDNLLLVWAFLLLIILNSVAIICFIYNDQLFFYEHKLAHFSDYLKLSLTIVCFNVSACQSFIVRHHELMFWKFYIKLRSTRGPLVQDMNLFSQLCEHKIFFVKFSVTFCCNLFFPILFDLIYLRGNSSLKFYWFSLSPFLFSLTRKMQFIFYLELIRMEVENLDRDLQTLVEFTEWERSHCSYSRFDEFLRRRILKKQRIYQDIFEMSQSFQKACNWSVISHLFYSYVKLLVNSYFCIYSFIDNWNPAEDILLIPAILEIPMFLLTAKSCTTAAKNISYRVHNLKHSAENIAASVQIQNFSLQLLHQQIKIDGLGIASMDGYMLTKAIGSITTYMIFFIQFMPKFKSKLN